MGVLRWEFSRVSVMMVRFLVIFSMYVRKRRTKIIICSCRLFVNLRRMNIVIVVWFFIVEFWLFEVGEKLDMKEKNNLIKISEIISILVFIFKKFLVSSLVFYYLNVRLGVVVFVFF